VRQDEVSLARILAAAGYHTGYAGKWHLDGSSIPGWVSKERSLGFEDCRYMFNKGNWKRMEDASKPGEDPIVFPTGILGDGRTYSSDWLAGKAVQFLQEHRTHPFYYVLSFPDPHEPFAVREPYASMYPDLPLPSTFRQDRLPDWAEAHRRASGFPLDAVDCGEKLKEMKGAYFGAVKLIDDRVGTVLDELERLDLVDNTIIAFTTDHGEYMGEHGLMGKNKLYETAYRIPFLIRYPPKIKPGTVIDKLVSTVDFQQTVLGLMELEPSGREQGHDASPLLQQECPGEPWVDRAFVYHHSNKRAGIFTPDYELAYVAGGEPLLFDRKGDPEQLHNLFTEDRYKDVVQGLTRELVLHHASMGSPATGWVQFL
jgi:uncharacterized sulfatase